jgi:hypothetical protein
VSYKVGPLSDLEFVGLTGDGADSSDVLIAIAYELRALRLLLEPSFKPVVSVETTSYRVGSDGVIEKAKP